MCIYLRQPNVSSLNVPSHRFSIHSHGSNNLNLMTKRILLFAFTAGLLPGLLLAQQPTAKELTNSQPQSPLVDSFNKYQQLKNKSLFGAEWISVGPVVNSARVESVQLDPTHPGTMYVAFGSGNLWKTTNNGLTWKPLFENQASHGIGDIALAPSNPNVIYLGTGESLKKARNFTIPGTGVYRSDDGGENWRHLGLSDSWHIGEIAVHPTNPDMALVAVLGHFWSANENRGLYRTEDGGKSWQRVLHLDNKTGANDVVWSHSDPNVVYASMWENHPGVCGANSSVHRSSDGGATWEKCENGFPSGDQIGRIGLAVSYSDANKVYALVDNREFSESAAAQVYQSIDGGKSWNRTHKEDLQFLSRIGWYFADIYVNPKNDEEIFALGVRVAHSVDGGKTFELISGNVSHINPSAAAGLHLDHCEMWINLTNPKHLVLGNDGGLYQSYDKGKSWLHLNNLPTGEFYDIAIDQSTPYKIYAGAQDDATVFGPATEFNPSQPDPWRYLWIDPWNGGDGCVSQVDPNDPNTVYFSAQEGAFRRKNMSTNRSKPIRPRFAKEFIAENPNAKLNFNFVAPMIISPHDSKTLYLGGNYIFKSKNRGDDWSVISPNVGISKDEKRQSIAAATIAESPRVAGSIYAGTDKGAVWVSEDAGQNWTERTGNLPIGYVRSIFPSKHHDSRAYLAMSGLNYDDFQTYLYCTEDRGKTWNPIASNLSNEPANVICEDPIHQNVLYAGLFRGVYISIDRGKSWSILGKNLPACSVADFEIHNGEKELIIATHGRGIYKTDLTPIHDTIGQKLFDKEVDHFFQIPIAKRPYLSDTNPSLNFRKSERTTFSFWLKKASKVKMSVFAANEKPKSDAASNHSPKPIVSFDIDGKKGLNQFRWDLMTQQTKSPAPYFVNYKSYLGVGEYRIQIAGGNDVKLTGQLSVVDSAKPNLP